MNEKGLVVLEEYALDVRGARRGRGSFLVETDKGLKLLSEFSGTEGRLAFQSRIMERLAEQGFPWMDLLVENREGAFLVKDREEISYILRDWYEGRECDARNPMDVLEAVRTLALLHKCAVLPEEAGRDNYGETSLYEEFCRKNAELRKVRKFIRGRRRKNEFEQGFLDCFEMFYEKSLLAEEAAGKAEQEELWKKSMEKGCLCHGDYNHHHMIFSREFVAVTEFFRCHFGVQTGDLAQFLRKVLEKQDWDLNQGRAMIREYEKVRILAPAERENLRLRLLYPEKFWKLANHYYGSNKAWLPKKNTEKLQLLAAQEKQKASFLKILE